MKDPAVAAPRPKVLSSEAANAQRTVLWVAAAAIVLTVVFGRLPALGKYSNVLQDSCHAPAFAALTLIALALLRLHRLTGASGAQRLDLLPTRRVLLTCIGMVLLMILLGAVTEIVQGVLGGDAEVGDLVSDGVGALGAGSLVIYLHLSTLKGSGARTGRRLSLLLGALLLLYWVTPILECAHAYWARFAQFPVLAQFRSPADLYFATTNVNDVRFLPGTRGTDGAVSSGGLRMVLDSGSWPGITLFEPSPDWRGYRVLALDLTNAGSSALPLWVRIDDRPYNGTFEDRFTTEFVLLPHERKTVRIRLEDIARSPRKRRMDMAHLAQLLLFRAGSAPDQVVVVHRIWLQ